MSYGDICKLRVFSKGIVSVAGLRSVCFRVRN